MTKKVGIFNILKPAPFKVEYRGNQEQILQDFLTYEKIMNYFFIVMDIVGKHIKAWGLY